MRRLIPLAVLLMLSSLQLWAQEGKLKNIQTSSVWAPAGVKVDGSLKEWDDTFQAYNKTTSLFYTVCNDDKYIYFVVKSIDVPNAAFAPLAPLHVDREAMIVYTRLILPRLPCSACHLSCSYRMV